MAANFIAKTSTKIDAPASIVWQALTSPQLISEYMFGSEVTSDWRVGGTITWRGTFQGKLYEDKGEILQFLPEKLLQHTYHSSLSGIADTPENYFNVTYELEEDHGLTTVTVINSNLPDEQSQEHAQRNWDNVLSRLKEVVEQRKQRQAAFH